MQRAQSGAGTLALTGWVLFDWAAQPVYTLVLTFLFAPFFANVFIANAVEGQAIWGYLTAATGLLVAVAGPVFGAIADASGRHKPWIAVFSIGLVAGLSGLWLAVPGNEARILPVCAAVILSVACVEFATVFTNAMMPRLVPRGSLGRLSGTGWAIGYIGGLISLVIAAGFMIADPETGRTMLGLKSVLPLDAFAYEGERAVGPFSALWYIIFVLPLFFFTPDSAPQGTLSRTPVRDGIRSLAHTIRHVRQYADILRFLIARMIYIDGLGAIFAFGGIYASAIFGWGPTQLGMFGVILAAAGAFGAFVGGWLDDRLGPRTVILLTLAGLAVASLGIVSIDRDSILFVLDVAPAVHGSGAFASVGEKTYLAFAMVIGMMAGPLQSASRTYLARIAPPDMITEFFGLYAFSGKITAFAAPLLVAMATQFSGSQRAGIAVILLFLLTGLFLMLGAKRVHASAEASG